MANYFVSSTGSNTSPYDTWAKAATTLATAFSAATSNGDVIAIDNASPPADITATALYTLGANISIVASTNSGTSTITPTPMGASAWIGSSSASWAVSFAGAFKVYIYGLTIRTAGTGNVQITIGGTDTADYTLEDCYLWSGTTTATAGRISCGTGSANGNGNFRFINCTFRFGATAQSISTSGRAEFVGGSVSSAGSAPSTLFSPAGNCTDVKWIGGDLSHVGSGTLVGSSSASSPEFWFDRCKLGSGYSLLASQTPANLSSARAYLLDCDSGDVHGVYGYADAMGTLTSETSIYYTSGVAGFSWKIVTTANAGRYFPFISPPLKVFAPAGSAITPYVEILRDGSTTAFNDDEVWAEFVAKVTSGYTQATLYTDRAAPFASGSAQANGAGLGSWTGESGTAWSGKIDSGSSLTPAEDGHMTMRVCVGAASTTVYVDPFVRT